MFHAAGNSWLYARSLASPDGPRVHRRIGTWRGPATAAVIGLATVAIAAAPASADFILRAYQAGVGSHVEGFVDEGTFRPRYNQTEGQSQGFADFLVPFDHSVSSSGLLVQSGMRSEASADGKHFSHFTLDPETGVLTLSASGEVNADAETKVLAFAKGDAAAKVDFVFELTKPYAFTFTGMASATHSRDGFGSLEGATANVLLHRSGVFQQLFARNWSDEVVDNISSFAPTGVLMPGEYQFTADARVISSVTSTPHFGAAVGDASAAGSANFSINFSLSPIEPDLFRWINPDGGLFSEGDNWETGTAPGADDQAQIDLPGAYTITLDENVTNESLFVTGGAGGIPTIDLNGFNYHVLSAIVGADGNDLINANIRGPGTLSVESDLIVADEGIIGFHVTDGAVLDVSQGGVVLGLQGFATVTVTESAELLAGVLIVGDKALVALDVRQEGYVQARDIAIGQSAGSDALVTVHGQGAALDALDGAGMSVGIAGKGHLSIEAGAMVTVDSFGVGIGLEDGGDGRMSIQGVSPAVKSVLNASGTVLNIVSGDVDAIGVLAISPHGEARFAIGQVGWAPEGTEAVTPSATVIVWGGDLIFETYEPDFATMVTGNVGFFIGGRGEVEVLEGGRIYSPTLVLDGHSTPTSFASASARISGSDSYWETTRMIVGFSERAFFSVEDFAIVSAGELDVSGEGKLTVSGGGILLTGFARVGRGLLDFEADSAVTVTGFGSLWSSDTIHVGDASGGSFGEVAINDGAVVSASIVRVWEGGTIYGSGGTLQGQLIIQSGGTIAPGLSPGTLTIEGDLIVEEGGILQIEFAGLGAGQFDTLLVTGDATLGGIVEMLFLDGYAPKTGDVLSFLEVGGVLSMEGAEFVFPNLLPGFEFATSFTGGAFSLTALNDAQLVPEPNTLILLALGGLAMLRRRGGRRRAVGSF